MVYQKCDFKNGKGSQLEANPVVHQELAKTQNWQFITSQVLIPVFDQMHFMPKCYQQTTNTIYIGVSDVKKNYTRVIEHGTVATLRNRVPWKLQDFAQFFFAPDHTIGAGAGANCKISPSRIEEKVILICQLSS